MPTRESQRLYTEILSFRRGVHRDLRSISRIHYFLWVSLAIFGALFVLDKELGHPDHDPILVMRLLRPILVKTTFSLD